MKRLLPLVVLAFVVLIAAPASASTQTVSIVDNGFNPSAKTVNRGDVVKWTNTGFNLHTSTGTAPLSLWASPDLSHTKTFTSATLTAAGTYPYYCKKHTFMKGSIKVPLSATKVGRKITLTLSSAAADATHKFVVQRKNGSNFVTLATVTTATYVFNATAGGTYQFRSALQKNGTTATAAFFSTPISVTVT